MLNQLKKDIEKERNKHKIYCCCDEIYQCSVCDINDAKLQLLTEVEKIIKERDKKFLEDWEYYEKENLFIRRKDKQGLHPQLFLDKLKGELNNGK